VRPAAAPLHIWQAVAALVAVRLQIALETFEEVRHMKPCPGLCIPAEDDGQQALFFGIFGFFEKPAGAVRRLWAEGYPAHFQAA